MGDQLAAERGLSAEDSLPEEACTQALPFPTVITHSSRAPSKQTRPGSRWLIGAIACLLGPFAGDSNARASNMTALSNPDVAERTEIAPGVHDVEKYGEGVEWSVDFDKAMTRGRAEGKPVLVAFSALRQEPECSPESEY